MAPILDVAGYDAGVGSESTQSVPEVRGCGKESNAAAWLAGVRKKSSFATRSKHRLSDNVFGSAAALLLLLLFFLPHADLHEAAFPCMCYYDNKACPSS